MGRRSHERRRSVRRAARGGPRRRTGGLVEPRGRGPDGGAFEWAFRFEEDPLAGLGLDAYLAHLAEVRGATLALFAARDDGWLAEPRTFAGHPSTTHDHGLRLLMDEARHTGQVFLLRKYLLPGVDGAFDPYGGP